MNDNLFSITKRKNKIVAEFPNDWWDNLAAETHEAISYQLKNNGKLTILDMTKNYPILMTLLGFHNVSKSMKNGDKIYPKIEE